MRRRRAVSYVYAALLLVVITVAAAYMLHSYFSSLATNSVAGGRLVVQYARLAYDSSSNILSLTLRLGNLGTAPVKVVKVFDDFDNTYSLPTITSTPVYSTETLPTVTTTVITVYVPQGTTGYNTTTTTILATSVTIVHTSYVTFQTVLTEWVVRPGTQRTPIVLTATANTLSVVDYDGLWVNVCVAEAGGGAVTVAVRVEPG